MVDQWEREFGVQLQLGAGVNINRFQVLSSTGKNSPVLLVTGKNSPFLLVTRKNSPVRKNYMIITGIRSKNAVALYVVNAHITF